MAAMMATRGLLRLHVHSRGLVPAELASARAQRRWWWDVDATRRKRDKPSVTGAKYTFIHAHMPVVMLSTVRGIGRQGQIVHVKRGFARHHLVPKGLAVFGTWENIDAYADPSLVEDPTLKARVEAERGRLPFDWVDDIYLTYVRWARDDNLSSLMEPITSWDLLEELSANHELDLLPGNLTVPETGISELGVHNVPVRIPFRNAESAAGSYTLRIELISLQSQQEELRRDEMARAVQDSMKFQLPQRGGAVKSAGDLEDLDEAFEE